MASFVDSEAKKTQRFSQQERSTVTFHRLLTEVAHSLLEVMRRAAPDDLSALGQAVAWLSMLGGTEELYLAFLDGEVNANPPVLMNEREVAQFVGICPRSVRNFTVRKLLPVIRLGRRRLYRRDAVLAALKLLENVEH